MKRSASGFWQIWNMSFGFLGIPLGLVLQNANVSRIFEALGAKIEDIPILWIAFPISGIIIKLIIGFLRDNNWSHFGRRQYFIVGAILASLALLFIPNSPTFWIAAGLFWILNAAFNISTKSTYAFGPDIGPIDQQKIGFVLRSFFISIGAMVASILPFILSNWFNVSNVAITGEKIPESVKLSFYLGGVVILMAAFWTFFATKIFSSEEIIEFETKKKQPLSRLYRDVNSSKSLLPRMFRNGFIWLFVGVSGSILINSFGFEKELYVLSIGFGILGLILLTSAWYTRQGLVNNQLVEVISDLMSIPKIVKKLAFVQFFSWFAIFVLWIYSTSAVTCHIYGTTNPSSALYNEGANWVGILFATYIGFAAFVTMLLPLFEKWIRRKIIHAISLMCGGIGLASFYIVKDPHILIISMLGVGIARASILSMPNAILTESLPNQKLGTNKGIFSFFIFIPQIFAASILGFFTKVLFNGQAIYALILGGISLLIAALGVLFIDDFDQRNR